MECVSLSPAPETRILFVGDMHLGRSPGRLPAVLNAQDFGPAAALKNIIDHALDLNVHAVAFAGDLVDGENAAFEAYGPLDRELRRLIGAGIEVCAVAGNHDTSALPRLAKVLHEGFHLLGPGGTWSEHIVESGDGPPVRLVGWSFPTSHYDTPTPLAEAPAAKPATITLGLLHCDLDVADSR